MSCFKLNCLSNLGNEPGNFDVVIVNDQLDKAYNELKEFLTPFIEEVKKN